MKKKDYWVIFLAIVLLLGAIHFYAVRARPVEDALPYLIMIDGELYQGYEIAQEKPEDNLEGYITKVIPGNEMPRENQTANFGSAGMSYWKSDNEIYMQTNDYYMIFVPI